MAQVFHGTTATEDMHGNPSAAQGIIHFECDANVYTDGESVASSPTAPAPSSLRHNTNFDDPSSGNQKRRVEDDFSDDGNSSGWRKQSTGARLCRTLKHMVDVVEKKGNQLHIVHDAPGCGIGDFLVKLMTLEGMNILDPLYMFATDLFSIAVHRKIFFQLPNDEARIAWLQYQKISANGWHS